MCRVFDVFVFKQKTAYEMRISDWSSDVCSSDLRRPTVADVEIAQCSVVLVEEQDTADAYSHIGMKLALAIEMILSRKDYWSIMDLGQCPERSDAAGAVDFRSEERRVGKECVSTCRSGWSPDN